MSLLLALGELKFTGRRLKQVVVDPLNLAGSGLQQAGRRQVVDLAGHPAGEVMDGRFHRVVEDADVPTGLAELEVDIAAGLFPEPDDVFVIDFAIPWRPPVIAMISDQDYERINKLVGHIVADPPEPFGDAETLAIIEPLVQVAVEFLQTCLVSGQASYTGKAGFYARRLNGTLRKIGISQLPNV